MSTILKALRKLEDDQPERKSADPTELDREVLEAPRTRPLFRIVQVLFAVLVSGLAGAGVTLGALTLWQTRNANVESAGEVPAVASAPVVSLPEAIERESGEEPTVIVVADVLKQRAANSEPGAPGAQFANDAPGGPALVAVELVPETTTTTVAPSHFAGEPVEPLPEPLALERQVEREVEREGQRELAREVPVRDPIAELAALRRSRVSRMPAAVRTVEPVESVMEDEAPAPIEAPPVPEPEPFESPELPIVEIAPEPEPQLEREAVPSFAITRTTWHPRQQRRRAEVSVMEEGGARVVELKEGDSLGPYEIREIGPTGVTFLHRGIEVQRRVGASHQ